MNQPLLTFVHISDSHIGATRDYELHGVATLPALEQVVSAINAMPVQPDFVLHTGDVTNHGTPESYALAAEAMGRLRAPVYYVAGNHDSNALMRSALDVPSHPGGEPTAPVDYQFEVQGERFVVLDAHSSAVTDPLGMLTAAQLDALRAECTPDGPPLTIVLHYMPFQTASPWLNDHMILVNGDDFHHALLPAKDRLRGVFFGHLHRNTHITRDGISYVAAPATSMQYGWRAWDELPSMDTCGKPGYNLIQYFAGYSVVTSYTL